MSDFLRLSPAKGYDPDKLRAEAIRILRAAHTCNCKKCRCEKGGK